MKEDIMSNVSDMLMILELERESLLQRMITMSHWLVSLDENITLIKKSLYNGQKK